MHIKNKRGQSTVEYILLVTAVLAVVIGFVATKGGVFQTRLNGTYDVATNQMNDLANRLADSETTAPASTAPTTPPWTVNVVP